MQCSSEVLGDNKQRLLFLLSFSPQKAPRKKHTNLAGKFPPAFEKYDSEIAYFHVFPQVL